MTNLSKAVLAITFGLTLNAIGELAYDESAQWAAALIVACTGFFLICYGFFALGVASCEK